VAGAAPVMAGRGMASREVEMAQGTVKWFSGGKGYGFIAVEGGPDVFVHVSGITGDGYRSLDEGQKSGFDITRASRDPRRKTSGSPADTPPGPAPPGPAPAGIAAAAAAGQRGAWRWRRSRGWPSRHDLED
jgi:CspA family cold shock protein